MRNLFVALCVAVVANTAAVHADVVSGKAHALDGDTLSINETVVRLYGIDAPEVAQNCKRASGKYWSCGKAATRKLKQLVRRKLVTCRGSEYDDYGRLIAVCTTNDHTDINQSMVERGLAVAYHHYTNRYAASEKEAQRNNKGIWATTFIQPNLYRQEAWRDAEAASPRKKCPIKGNINRRGERIYHTPWSKVYSKTRINIKKGERWFCSEKDALEAGWRSSLYK